MDSLYEVSQINEVNREGAAQILAKYRIHAKSVTGKKYKMILPQFKVYYNIEKLGLMKSLYYLLYWSLHGIKKYYKKRMK